MHCVCERDENKGICCKGQGRETIIMSQTKQSLKEDKDTKL